MCFFFFYCFFFFFFFFFFNDTATTEIYTLSLHDALRSRSCRSSGRRWSVRRAKCGSVTTTRPGRDNRVVTDRLVRARRQPPGRIASPRSPSAADGPVLLNTAPSGGIR